MVYLTNDDLISQIFEEFIDDSEQEDLDILTRLESQSIAIIKSKLRERYDTESIFAQRDEERDPLIIGVLTALVNYKLIRRNAVRKIPEDFKTEYKNAMNWLNDVRDGIERPDLPLLDSEEHQELYYGDSINNNWREF
jgi:hypothetical protein